MHLNLERTRKGGQQTVNVQANYPLLHGRQEGMYRNAEGAALADESPLVAQAKSGGSNAFGELYERHRERIYRCAFRIVRNRQDAEDVVQLSFHRAFTNLGRFREDSTFSTWVTRIAMNEALIMLRQRRATTPIVETTNNDPQSVSAFHLVDERPTPEQAIVANERHTVLIQAISRLQESLRKVVLLREFQGLTSAETARRLGLTVPAVKARTFHARRHLRQHLRRKYRSFPVATDRNAKKREMIHPS
jgi:RNA polymerase sigma-70 factor, ECF subfamily